MHRIGRFVFQGQVRALLVVDQDRLPHHPLRLCQVYRSVKSRQLGQFGVGANKQASEIGQLAPHKRAPRLSIQPEKSVFP